jgi:hypothetical protein
LKIFKIQNRQLKAGVFATSIVLLNAVLVVLLSFTFSLLSADFSNNYIVQAATSDTVSFQGKIVRNDFGSIGVNVSSSETSCIAVGADTCQFKASYYDDAVGTTLLGSETFSNVELGDNDGIFNLLFGTQTFTAGAVSTFTEIFTDGYDDVFVKVEFAPDGVSFSEDFGLMGMRATPYALSAKYLGGLDASGFLQLAPSAAQVDSSTNSSIFVNKTGASGNLLELQKDGTTEFIVDTDGNVGIGDSTPSERLDVAGNIYLHNNQLLFDSRISGYDFIQGNVTASGTKAGTNSMFQFKSIYDDVVIQAGINDSNPRAITLRSGETGLGLVVSTSGKIGIHTTVPYQQLSIGDATSGITTGIGLDGDTLGGTITHVNMRSGIGDTIWQLVTRNDSFGISYGGTTDLNNALTIENSGEIGIGDTTPNHTLDVAGNIGLDMSGYINWGDVDADTGYGLRDLAGVLQYKNSAGSWADLGAGSSNFLSLSDTMSSYTAGSILFTSGAAVTEDNSNFFWDDTNNRLGLGTTLPLEMLDINGRLYIADSTAPGTTTNRLYAVAGDLYWGDFLLNGNTGGDSSFFTVSGTIASGSYLELLHNQNTYDVLASSWISTQGIWKELDADYMIAGGWEGVGGAYDNYRSNLNDYVRGNTDLYTMLDSNTIFDTFEDSTKSASTSTVSKARYTSDSIENSLFSSNREAQGRIGLWGGQSLTTAITDNSGNTYLGSNSVNDIFHYDRGHVDSDPEVQIELGIDPNWYNGVTLTSADPAPNGNLSLLYNGSLITATGRYTASARGIDITIKSSTTFDWTDNNGNSGTGVTIVPGTAQSLGTTGVSIEFEDYYYNVGDVFKVASWYVEPESSTRGEKQEFPYRAEIIATNSSVDIIDADTQKLWMRFSTGGTTANNSYMVGATNDPINAITALNGAVITGNTGTVSNSTTFIKFYEDEARMVNATTSAHIYNGVISQRNSGLGLILNVYGGLGIVDAKVNDISAAVIPNQPTQEVTVSGWGYQIAQATTGDVMSESVSLPYKFNSTPEVLISTKTSGTIEPTKQSDCTSRSVLTNSAHSVTESSFTANAYGAGTGWTGYYICYTWTATGTVSPKQFVAVATGDSAGGGTTVINETDGTVAHVKSNNGVAVASNWQNKVALASNNLYIGHNNSGLNLTNLHLYYGVHGLQTEVTTNIYRRGFYRVGGSTEGIKVTVLGNATGTDLIQSLEVIEGASTVNSSSNTIYAGTAYGVSRIQENQGFGTNEDGSEEDQGSVKYYTKDYISEEMVGDIRGMWPLNGNNTSSDFEDVSVKANALTGTNITSADAVSGVRGEAYDFDGSTEYLTHPFDTDFNLAEEGSIGAWIKTTSSSTQYIISLSGCDNDVSSCFGTPFRIQMSAGLVQGIWLEDGTSNYYTVASSKTYNDGNWHHVVTTLNDNEEIVLYVDGQVVDTATFNGSITVIDNDRLFIGATWGYLSGVTGHFNGTIDEPFVTASAIPASKIKQMYETGKRALASHGTNLGGGSADANQSLGGTTNVVGAARPDWNNQFLYVGTNSTTLGALTKIQLNSDSNIKTYTSSSNTPAGGSTLIDEDTASLGVGYDLEAVGSAASGVKLMGSDNYATSTSGIFYSKTYTLDDTISSGVVWISANLDADDVSNTLAVEASNDGGSTYDTCVLTNSNNLRDVPEYMYSCEFTASDNDVKVKLSLARGSTKTSTYITEYGFSWLGADGFRLELTDTNTIRLYNDSGASQDLKLVATVGVATGSLFTDTGDLTHLTSVTDDFVIGGTTLSNSMFSIDESLGIFNFGGDLSANPTFRFNATDGDTADFGFNTNDSFYFTGGNVGIGTTSPDYALQVLGDIVPETDDTYDLGTTALRWQDLYLGPNSLHIGTDGDEGVLSYNTAGDAFTFDNNVGIAASGYINFATTYGTTGYGFRDNAGNLEYKNSAGSWAALGSGGASDFLSLSDTMGSYTAGSVLFTSGSAVTQDNANFFWDDTNNRLGIGTVTPGRALEVNGAIRFASSTIPSTPVSGDVYNSGTNLYYYNGTNWVDLTANAIPNEVYYDSDVDVSITYAISTWYSINDGSSNWQVTITTDKTSDIRLDFGTVYTTNSASWGGHAGIYRDGVNIKIYNDMFRAQQTSGMFEAGGIYIDENVAAGTYTYEIKTAPAGGIVSHINIFKDHYLHAEQIGGTLSPGNLMLFTDAGAVTYLDSVTDDFVIGGTTLASSIFAIDESAGIFEFSSDLSANPTFRFNATDGDTADFGFNTNDSFYFTGGNVGVGTTTPESVFHVKNDQDLLTELRIDNTNDSTDIDHTGIGLYDGTSRNGHLTFNNNTDVLSVGASNAFGKLALYSGGVEAIRVDTAGQVGIGNIAPDGTLDIRSSTGSDGSIVLNTTDADNNTSDSKIIFRENGISKWRLQSDGDASDKLELSAGEGGTQIFSADQSGNIVFGPDDSIPDALFHINKDQEALTEFRLDNSNNGTDIDHIGLSLYDGSTLNGYLNYNNYSDILSLGANDALGQFRILTGGSESLRVLANGNVGIGTTTPANKLSIAGADESVSVQDGNYGYFSANPVGAQIGKWGDSYTNASGIKFHRWEGVTDLFDVAYVGQANGSTSDWGLDFRTDQLTTGFADATTSRMFISSTGSIGIGTTSPTMSLTVNGSSSWPILLRNTSSAAGNLWYVGPDYTNNFVIYNQSGTGQWMASGGTTWQANSDQRLKYNVATVPSAEGLSAIMQLDPVHYNWRDINSLQSTQVGFIAQEVQSIFPDIVMTGDTRNITLSDGTTEEIVDSLSISYTSFIPYMVKATQEQQYLIEGTQAPLAILQNLYDSETKISEILLAAEETNAKITSLENAMGQLDQGIGSGFWEYTEFSINTEKPIYSPSIYSNDGVFANLNSNMLNTGLGLFTVDELGTVVAKGDTYFEAMIYGLDGVVKFADGIFAPEVTTQVLNVNNELGENSYSIDDTGKVSIIADNEDATLGTGHVITGESFVTILSSQIKENSKVFVTVKVTEGGEIPAIAVTNVIDGSFDVVLNGIYADDVLFDWWIVDPVVLPDPLDSALDPDVPIEEPVLPLSF